MWQDIEVLADRYEAEQNLLRELAESGEFNPSEISTVETDETTEELNPPF